MMGYKITRLKDGKYWLKIGNRIFIIEDLGYFPPDHCVRWEAYITDTVSRLCAGGALKHGSFNPPLNFNRITNDKFSR